MYFAEGDYVYLLITIPLFIMIYIFYHRSRKKALQKIGKYQVIRNQVSNPFQRIRHIKFILLLFVISFSILALMRPKWGKKPVSLKYEGIEIVVALDVSLSMLAEDVAPNRLELAKDRLRKLLDMLRGNRVALILFSGEARIECPLTTSIESIKNFYIDNANAEETNVQGTVFSDAINKSLNIFTEQKGVNRALIILSDGEVHEERRILNDVLGKIRKREIVIFAVGVGKNRGSRIPIKTKEGRLERWKTDKDGNEVVTKLNEEILSDIARKTSGKYFHWAGSENEGGVLYERIALFDKTDFGIRQIESLEDQYQYFVFVAVILFIAMLLLPDNLFVKKSNA